MKNKPTVTRGDTKLPLNQGWIFSNFTPELLAGLRNALTNGEELPVQGVSDEKHPTGTTVEECNDFNHDFKHLKRYGRADWRCPKCDTNVMLLLVTAQQAGIDLTE